MIRLSEYTKQVSPKVKAKEIFFYKLQTITDYALEEASEGMTDAEIEAVQNEMEVLHNRIIKLINFKVGKV